MVYHTFRARDRAHTHPTARANDVHSAKKRQNLMKRQKKNVIDADENPFSRDDATMRRARTPRVCVQRLSLDVFRCVSRPVNPRASRGGPFDRNHGFASVFPHRVRAIPRCGDSTSRERRPRRRALRRMRAIKLSRIAHARRTARAATARAATARDIAAREGAVKK